MDLNRFIMLQKIIFMIKLREWKYLFKKNCLHFIIFFYLNKKNINFIKIPFFDRLIHFECSEKSFNIFEKCE